MSHRRRQAVASSHPVHVTLRVRRHVWNLRARRCRRILEAAFASARERNGLRLVHYSIQGDHVHLLVEARGREALARGVQGLSVRIARGLNRLMSARGKVLSDRYHAHVLRTPKEVRHALRYVLRNADRHGLRWRTGPRGPKVDPCSSGRWFDGWKGDLEPESSPRPVSPPGTWLLRVGWRRHGLLPLA